MDAFIETLAIWIFLLVLLAALLHARDTFKEKARWRQYQAERDQHDRNMTRLAENLAWAEARQASRIAALVAKGTNAPAVWRRGTAPVAQPAEVE